MITNSRAALKEPREIGKKNPGKTYLPRFLDQSSKEDLKSSVERELADISMYMEKERQIVDKLVPGSIFKGTWDACSDKYPDGGGENSTWDVLVSCGVTHDFDGKTWEAGHELLYFSVSDIYVQRTNPGTDGIKHIIDEIKVEIDESKAIIQENKLAIAETNLALAEESKKLEASIGENTSKINITNQVVTDLTQTVATNKTELTSTINGVKDVVDKNKVDGDKADADNNRLIVQAQADLAITNQTVATLEGSLATNITELRAEYKAADSKVASDAAAALSVTNKTVADNYSSLSSSITNLTSNYDGQIANINSSLSTTANKVGNLEAKWTVQADVNGKISGIEMVNDGRKSNFTILTDRFVVTDGSTTKPPFSIESGKVAMKDVRVSGHIEAGSGTFKGRVEADSGFFKGEIRGDSGYFNGSLNVQAQGGNVGMKITNNQILIYDQNGVLRVKIGQL